MIAAQVGIRAPTLRSWLAPPPFSTTISATNVACSASSATRRRLASPISASTPCSTAARSPRGSSPPTASGSGSRRRMGLVNDVFTDARLDALVGDQAMGHVRYSTAGDTVTANAQPILIDCHRGPIALGHNGNIVNASHPAPRAGGGGLHLPVHLGHRGHPPPLRAQPPRDAGGRDRGQPLQGDGRVFARLPDPRRPGGRARPLGLPPARHRKARGRVPSWPPRPAPSTSSTPNTCATWSRAS